MAKIVEDGIIGIHYWINEYWADDDDNLTQYDWETDADESDIFFNTHEEAVAAVRARFK
jgi:hypothetical protein